MSGVVTNWDENERLRARIAEPENALEMQGLDAEASIAELEAERDRLREGIFRYASGSITFDELRALCERSSEAAKEAAQ